MEEPLEFHKEPFCEQVPKITMFYNVKNILIIWIKVYNYKLFV